ncbi:CDP-glucose 4,6-dehydratase [Mesorhizobium sp. B1-1-8]|uniref:CDP-glucose 4,6-dehydratase n=1 Tax=Mesorhizobium sp. B1-1-8 TaxID=2589976 RepID=UPI00112DD6E1|nr:CDP-glucose 4,6-dehydratase [Mesorhizobium sp. B1-1-8]UCI06845.1 CDP-glucose 4,6-dehydratase [Mesorhizobium sp. B1-1-8]
MEDLELKQLFGGVYHGRKVLLTGHTGFKGSWLALWLTRLGAEVTALALPPATTPNHWETLDIDIDSRAIDVRDGDAVAEAVRLSRPEIVFHLAAQPLVRQSYRDPVANWSTNVMGTVHVLDACRAVDSLKAAIVVTSDKCYENRGWEWGYRETDSLGGHDPYSTSKAAAEFVVQSYRRSFFGEKGAPLIASARAGNVFGGGDWSEDRLIPDLVRAVASSRSVEIRSPRATRPWQHVLECLSGYLVLGQHLLDGDEDAASAWNFGPDNNGNRTVEELLLAMKANWPGISWIHSNRLEPHEATMLHLDSSRAFHNLGWRPIWTFEEGVAATALWYERFLGQREVLSLSQLQAFERDATERAAVWTREPSGQATRGAA